MKNLANIIAAVSLSLLSSVAAYGWRAPLRDLPQGISLETASAAEQKGDIARARTDYPTAAAYYQRALRAGTPDAQLYNKLGIVQLKLNETSAARKSFLAALKTDPRNAIALNNLGALMCVEKKYKTALNYEKEALAIDEENPAFHVNMAETWAGLSQIDRAMTEYARALELNPDVFSSSEDGVIAQVRSPEQVARMDYLIARIFARRGNLEGALDYLGRAKQGHYPQLDDVYVDKEFAALWQDPRLQKIVKP
ncbi:MAG TPA: tetratricopeptide repeat protein [Terracidiphilus sp.]|jgi:tetratricopeptide (TPR) repeat protein